MPSIGVNDDPIRRLVPVLPTSGGSSTMAGPKNLIKKCVKNYAKTCRNSVRSKPLDPYNTLIIIKKYALCGVRQNVKSRTNPIISTSFRISFRLSFGAFSWT